MQELMNIIKYQDSIPKSIFLDSADLRTVSLSYKSNTRHVWNDINDSIKSINQFYDIRLKFDSDSAALAFHKKFLPENSENGPEIKKPKIKVDGIKELGVYTMDKKKSEIFLEPYGFQALCFIYVVDNYFVKHYTTCLKEYKPSFFKSCIVATRDKIRAQ